MSKCHRSMLRSLPHPRPTKARPFRLSLRTPLVNNRPVQCWFREAEKYLADHQGEMMKGFIDRVINGGGSPENPYPNYSELSQYFAPIPATPQPSPQPEPADAPG